MSANDALVSQFLALTGISDTDRAASYLEMSGNDIETAVGLFMDHQAGGGGGGVGGGAGAAASAGGAGLGSPEVRAPDATRTMRLMDDGPHGYMHMDAMMEDRHFSSAFAAPNPFGMDARAAVNAASAAAESENDPNTFGGESKENEMKDSSDDDDGDNNAGSAGPAPAGNLARLADMFAPPDHLIFKEGGFEGARNMAKDNKRWLLVNIQRDSEFSCHALNRDVWRDELVENLVREGFIFWQTVSD